MNYWILGKKSLAEYPTYLTPLNGDLKALTLQDDSIDIGNQPVSPVHILRAGRRVKTDNLPTKVSVDKGIETVDDLFKCHTDFTVSEALKALLEQLAPGDIQFEPFQVLSEKTGQVEATRYWLIPNVRLFAMNKDATRPGFTRKGYFLFSAPLDEQHIVFDASVTRDKPIFVSAEYPGVIFVHDRVVNEIRTSGLTGTAFGRYYPVE